MAGETSGEGPPRIAGLRWLADRAGDAHPLRLRIGIGALAFALALLLRVALDPVVTPGFPFMTFFPAILLAVFLAGAGVAAAVAAASGIAAWFLFIEPVRSFALSGAALVALGLFALVAALQIGLVHALGLALRRLRRTDEESRARARSRELMFQELQHRVSNNLGTVAALLRLQRRRVADDAARQALDEAHNRIAVVARLQRRLHNPDRQEIDFGRFLESMVEDTLSASGAGGRVRCRVEADTVFVTQDRAIPLGLIASEFLMNAIEHGADWRNRDRARPPADIRLSLRRTGGGGDARVTLEVRDDGAGVPDGFDPAASGSLGLEIAGRFAEQLGGALEIATHPEGGGVSRLVFPLPGGGEEPAAAPGGAAPQEAEARVPAQGAAG